jgi:hypothetical protein
LGTDIGGLGNWSPRLGITLSHHYYLLGLHYIALRLSGNYNFSTDVHVKGFNAYGGGKGTRGRVDPGNLLVVFLGLEYSLTQDWALALDLDYTHSDKTTFHGKRGRAEGLPNSVGSPSSEQFNLAPAIEYNWSENVGIIAGAWFTVAGRNSTNFAIGVVAINIYK